MVLLELGADFTFLAAKVYLRMCSDEVEKQLLPGLLREILSIVHFAAVLTKGWPSLLALAGQAGRLRPSVGLIGLCSIRLR